MPATLVTLCKTPKAVAMAGEGEESDDDILSSVESYSSTDSSSTMASSSSTDSLSGLSDNSRQSSWMIGSTQSIPTLYMSIDDIQCPGASVRFYRISLIVLCFLSLATALPLSLVGPFFPGEALNHGCSLMWAGVILSAFPMATFLSAPLFGLLVPTFGPKFLIVGGGVAAGVATAAFALVDNCTGIPFVAFSMLMRISQGVGSAACSTGSNALMTSLFPQDIAKMAGLLEVFCSIGFMLGPVLGGILFEYGGFCLPFVTVGVFTLLTMFPLMIIIPRRQQSVLQSSNITVGQILRCRGVFLVFMSSVCGMSVFSFLELALQPEMSSQNLSTTAVGLLFVLISAIYALSAPLVGWLSAPPNTRSLIVIGLCIISVALCLLGPAPGGFIPRSLVLQICSLVFLSIGCALVLVPVVPQMVALTNHLGQGSSDVLAGVLIASYSLGEIVGPLIAGSLLQTVGMSFGSAIYALCVALFAVAIIVSSQFEVTASIQENNKRVPLLQDDYQTAVDFPNTSKDFP